MQPWGAKQAFLQNVKSAMVMHVQPIVVPVGVATGNRKMETVFCKRNFRLDDALHCWFYIPVANNSLCFAGSNKQTSVLIRIFRVFPPQVNSSCNALFWRMNFPVLTCCVPTTPQKFEPHGASKWLSRMCKGEVQQCQCWFAIRHVNRKSIKLTVANLFPPLDIVKPASVYRISPSLFGFASSFLLPCFGDFCRTIQNPEAWLANWKPQICLIC